MYRNLRNFLYTNASISLILLYSLYLSGINPSIYIIATIVIMIYLFIQIGLNTLIFISNKNSLINLSEAFIIGYAIASFSIFIISFFLIIEVYKSLVIVCILTLIWTLILYKKGLFNNDRIFFPKLLPFFILACLLCSTVSISSFTNLNNQNILPIWNDYLLHGNSISSLGSNYSGFKNMELSGQSLPPYHYGIYIFPAILANINGISPLSLSTSILLPIGLIIGIFGISCFSQRVFVQSFGYYQLILIIFIPIYSIFINSGWFDFHWLLFTAPGTAYAIGLTLVILLNSFLVLNKECYRPIFLIIILFICLAFTRIHALFLVAPIIFSIMIIKYFFKDYSKVLILISFFIILIIFCQINITDKTYNYVIWANSNSTFFDYKISEFKILLDSFSFNILYMLISILGLYSLIYLYSLYLYKKINNFNLVDLIPFLSLAVFILLVLYSNDNIYVDISEFKHRVFPIIYVIFSIYTIAYTEKLFISRYKNININNYKYQLFFIAGFSLFYIINNINPALPKFEKMPWAKDYFNETISPNIINASDYIRRNSFPLDSIAMPKVFISGTSNLLIKITSFSTIPAYLLRPENKFSHSNDCINMITKKRIDVLNQIGLSQNWNAVNIILAEENLRWLITNTAHPFQWDTNFKYSTIKFGDIIIYDFGHSNKKNSLSHDCKFYL